MSKRIVCWYSCGAASTVATKLAIKENNESENPKELVVASIFLKNEHPDSERFKRECEQWFDQPIVELRCEKYDADVDTVIEKTGYMSGVSGARCTKELKKQVRLDWQRPDDIHVFGMDCNEEDRIDNLLDTEPELDLWAPLIDKGYSKADCFEIISDLGIELPEMYKLGYYNNNCIGCLKAAGAGYWNKIRVDFPDVFARRAEQERMLNVALVMMTTNTYFNKHREDALRNITEFNRSIKFNGGESPVSKNLKLNNCILVDKQLLDDNGVSYNIMHSCLPGAFKGCDYEGVLIETKYLIDNHVEILKTILTDKIKYPVVKVFNTRVRIPLRFLPINAGSHKDLDIGSCGFFCEIKDNPFKED